jgi:hypothetical protein
LISNFLRNRLKDDFLPIHQENGSKRKMSVSRVILRVVDGVGAGQRKIQNVNLKNRFQALFEGAS